MPLPKHSFVGQRSGVLWTWVLRDGVRVRAGIRVADISAMSPAYQDAAVRVELRTGTSFLWPGSLEDLAKLIEGGG